jgi:hypothetical protein
MKMLLKALVLVVIVVAAAVVALFFYVDRLARVGVERGASYALGVPTALASADVGVLSGTFSMRGLNIDNPAGFDSPHFIRLDDAGVSVSLASLRGDTVELPELSLSGLDLNLHRQKGSSNYGVILENLKRFESGEKPEGESAEGGKKFVIRTIEITDVVAHVNLLPAGGEVTQLDVPIERITLTDVGSGSDKGVLLTELSSVLMKAILAAVVQKGGNLIPMEILGDLESGLAQLGSLGDMGITALTEIGGSMQDVTGVVGTLTGDVEDKVKGLSEDVTKGVTEEAEKAVEGALKGVGDLLGGKKGEGNDGR